MSDTPVVLINGPRQCGKTTLVKLHGQEMPYFTLDDSNLLLSVRSDPVGFIRRIDRAVIDEVQHAPELLRAIKLSGGRALARHSKVGSLVSWPKRYLSHPNPGSFFTIATNTRLR